MNLLRTRKTKLQFITNATVRYRGKDRDVVIEALPDYLVVRLRALPEEAAMYEAFAALGFLFVV